MIGVAQVMNKHNDGEFTEEDVEVLSNSLLRENGGRSAGRAAGRELKRESFFSDRDKNDKNAI